MTPHAAHSPSILVYGRDASLLRTRGWVLEKAGFQVVQVQTIADIDRIKAVQPSLVILCHTLSAEQRQCALVTFESLWPGVKKLFMTANIVFGSNDRSTQTVSAFEGPRALIEVARKMLA